ncbi:MAG: Demethylrebeccamycin-D-glucose O-methyltransferase [Planctomycetota bacterium]|jgi:ubiquinone/menaquinone biosynthesis C-methylase UbiE
MIARVLEPEVMDTREEADGYDAMDHSAPNAAFARRMLELGARGRVLDIGCGPGHIPLLLCEALPDSRVVGVDLAEHMLRHAEAKRARSPHAARLSFQRCDAKGLPFADASFDAVCSNTILHHIPDPRPFLREARRVLAPGGALLVRDLVRPWSHARVAELVALHAAGGTSEQQELFRASLCAAFTPFELRAIADECGLAAAEITIDSDRHMSLQLSAGI